MLRASDYYRFTGSRTSEDAQWPLRTQSIAAVVGWTPHRHARHSSYRLAEFIVEVKAAWAIG